MYVIKRTDQGGGYVAKPGRQYSYTKNMKYAQKYESKGDAEADCCPGNEVVRSVEDEID